MGDGAATTSPGAIPATPTLPKRTGEGEGASAWNPSPSPPDSVGCGRDAVLRRAPPPLPRRDEETAVEDPCELLREEREERRLAWSRLALDCFEPLVLPMSRLAESTLDASDCLERLLSETTPAPEDPGFGAPPRFRTLSKRVRILGRPTSIVPLITRAVSEGGVGGASSN